MDPTYAAICAFFTVLVLVGAVATSRKRRLRSKRSWLNWEPEDVREELAPWPSDVRALGEAETARALLSRWLFAYDTESVPIRYPADETRAYLGLRLRRHLELALTKFITAKGMQFGGMERRGWNRVRVVFGKEPDFFILDAAVPPPRKSYANIDALDDALYDAAVKEFDRSLASPSRSSLKPSTP